MCEHEWNEEDVRPYQAKYLIDYEYPTVKKRRYCPKCGQVERMTVWSNEWELIMKGKDDK